MRAYLSIPLASILLLASGQEGLDPPETAMKAPVRRTTAEAQHGRESPEKGQQDRETIFDRVVHLEQQVHADIPRVPRWEEELGIEGRKVRVGDVDLWVEEEGDGVPLVLLHGGPGSTHHGFHPWFGRAANFSRVIYFDQRGCGLSDYDPGPDGYSVNQAVEDLEGLRKVLGLDRFVLVGFSYGGFLAQYYTTLYPERVAGLVLVGAMPGMDADLGDSRQQEFIAPEEREWMERMRDDLRALPERSTWSYQEYVARIVYNNHLNGDWKRQHYYKPSPKKMARIALYEWVQDRDFNSVMSRSAGQIDLTGAFAESPVPTIIMEGDWDLTWGPEKVQVLTGNHPNARLVAFQRSGHSIFADEPDRFFSVLRRFLEDLEPVTAADLQAYREHLDAWRGGMVQIRDGLDSSQALHMLGFLDAVAQGKDTQLPRERVMASQGTDLILRQMNLFRRVSGSQYEGLLKGLVRGELPSMEPVDSTRRARNGVRGLVEDVWPSLEWGVAHTAELRAHLEHVGRLDLYRRSKALAEAYLPTALEGSPNVFAVMGGRAGAAAMGEDALYIDLLVYAFRSRRDGRFPSDSTLTRIVAHELHHVGYEHYLTTFRETLEPDESDALQFSFLSSLLLEGSATYLISGKRDLATLSLAEPYSGHLDHPESLVARVEDILQSVQSGEIRSRSQLDTATADLLGSWFHSAGSFLLGVVDQSRGLEGVMKVLEEPETLLVAYNQAVEGLPAGNSLPRFQGGVAARLMEVG